MGVSLFVCLVTAMMVQRRNQSEQPIITIVVAVTNLAFQLEEDIRRVVSVNSDRGNSNDVALGETADNDTEVKVCPWARSSANPRLNLGSQRSHGLWALVNVRKRKLPLPEQDRQRRGNLHLVIGLANYVCSCLYRQGVNESGQGGRKTKESRGLRYLELHTSVIALISSN